jgi:hypothetical protein
VGEKLAVLLLLRKDDARTWGVPGKKVEAII